MRPRPQQQPKGPLELGPTLYQARRPTSSPTKSLRLQRPHLRGATATTTAAAAAAAAAPGAERPMAPSRSSSATTGGVAPAASAMIGVTAGLRVPPPRAGVLPYAPSASAGMAVRMAVRRSGSLSRGRHPDGATAVSTPDPPSQASSSFLPAASASLSSSTANASQPPSSLWRPSFLETLLQYALSVEEQYMADGDVESAGRALDTLRHRRRQRKGARPAPPTSLAGGKGPSHRRLSSASSLSSSSSPSGGPRVSEDVTAAALVAACEAATPEAALGALLTCYSPSATSTSTSSSSSSSCLLAAAIVELRGQLRQLTADDLALLDAAASGGHPGAMLRVGLCLRDGIAGDLPVDLSTALTYMEASAGAGYVPAIHEMGLLYEVGCSSAGAVLAPDWGEALRWYRRAAAAGYVPSQLNLGKLLLAAAEEQLASSVASSEELSDLRQRSREWLEQASQSGSEEATRLLRRI